MRLTESHYIDKSHVLRSTRGRINKFSHSDITFWIREIIYREIISFRVIIRVVCGFHTSGFHTILSGWSVCVYSEGGLKTDVTSKKEIKSLQKKKKHRDVTPTLL